MRACRLLTLLAAVGPRTSAFEQPLTRTAQQLRPAIAARRACRSVASADTILADVQDAETTLRAAREALDSEAREALDSEVPQGLGGQRSNMGDAFFGLAMVVPAVLVCFGVTAFITSLLAPLTAAWAQNLKLVYAAAVAGIVSRSCCAPLEMVSTVMMCRGDECSSVRGELASAWQKGGLKGLFKGNGANCLKVAPNRGAQFLAYEFLKRKLVLITGVASLSAGSRFLAGGLAGMFAALVVYPLEVVKTVLTLYPDECRGIGDAAGCIVKYGGGIRGLYRGVLPTLIAMFPYVGVEFMVYETLKRSWEGSFGAISTAALLLIGAVGGAAGQTSAHPLDVVRRRMQMQGMPSSRAESSQNPEGGEENTAAPRYPNMFSALFSIGKEEGLHVLFKGLGPACFEKVPSTAIGYFILEGLKRAMNVVTL